MGSRWVFVGSESLSSPTMGRSGRRLLKSNDAHALPSIDDSLVANTDRLAPTALAGFGSPLLWLRRSALLCSVAVRGDCRNAFARGHSDDLHKIGRWHIRNW